MFFLFSTATEVALQLPLLDANKANTELDEGFLRMLAELVGSQWSSLASLLSYTRAEVKEAMLNENPALSLLKRWKQHTQPTYGYLFGILKAAFLLPSFFVRARQSALAQSIAAERHDIQLYSNVGMYKELYSL